MAAANPVVAISPALVTAPRSDRHRVRPLLSVVVSAGADVPALQRCLDALLMQDFDGSRYEIVVVEARDPLSVAATGKFAPDRDERLPSVRRVVLDAARRGAGSPAVQYLPADRQPRPRQSPDEAYDLGLNAARNRGWHFARGSILVFLDAALVPGRDWLQQGLSALTTRVAAVSGRVRVASDTPPNEGERDAATLAARGQFGSNCFIRRAALAAVGGYDERFPADWRTDADLQYSLIEHFDGQLEIRQAPLAEATWQAPSSTWGSSLPAQRNLQFDSLLARKHPRLYRQGFGGVPQAMLRWTQTAIVLLLAVLVGAAVAAELSLTYVALALWSALTASVCAVRLRGTRHDARHVLEMILTSIAVPPLAVFWRLVGRLRYWRLGT